MRKELLAACTLILGTACAGLRSSVIQAPTEEERELSRRIYDGGGFKDGATDDAKRVAILGQADGDRVNAQLAQGDLFLHKDFRSADAYCRNITAFGQDAYKANLGWGISLSLLGIAGTAAGTAWVAASDDKADGAVAKVTLAASSAVVAAIGLIFVGRAGAAATASGDAGLAFVPETKPSDQWKVCLAARGKWLGSNADAAKVAKASGGGDGGSDKDDTDADAKGNSDDSTK